MQMEDVHSLLSGLKFITDRHWSAEHHHLPVPDGTLIDTVEGWGAWLYENTPVVCGYGQSYVVVEAPKSFPHVELEIYFQRDPTQDMYFFRGVGSTFMIVGNEGLSVKIDKPNEDGRGYSPSMMLMLIVMLRDIMDDWLDFVSGPIGYAFKQKFYTPHLWLLDVQASNREFKLRPSE